jgi:hypothetical protein
MLDEVGLLENGRGARALDIFQDSADWEFERLRQEIGGGRRE